MQLTRCRDRAGQIRWVVPVDAKHARPLLAQDPYGDLEAAADVIDVDAWLAPLQPACIFGVGLNYRAHAAETGATLPEHPVLFMKPPSTVIGPGET
ncbi:MAG: 5-carboxymethyl-2-hydroxymuconate isomerase, partial [Gammaproteobacteria bacterium]|nr:5-carboxymethyl-2-hydroxymuconate isomerase [Gammaproteobacteria bacterium]